MKSLPILLAFFLSGCVSQVLPPKVPPSSFKIDGAISVSPDNKSLRGAIEGTGIFTEVKSSNSESISAKANRGVVGSTVIPLLTFFSLGIIPTIAEEELGQSILLNYRGKTYGIEATWYGNTVLGWAALPMNLSPNRTSKDTKTHPRFYSFLKHQIEEAVTQ